MCDTNCVAEQMFIQLLFFEGSKKYNNGYPQNSSEFELFTTIFSNYTANPPNSCGTDDGSVGADSKCTADEYTGKFVPTTATTSEPTIDYKNKEKEEEFFKHFSSTTS